MIVWHKRSSPEKLSTKTGHLWRVQTPLPDTFYSQLKSVLSLEEQKRAAAFLQEKERILFISSRGVLRFLLGQYLERAPHELLFSYGAHGKPFIAESSISFNVSHTGSYILLLFAKRHAVGVDIEQIKTGLPFDRIMNRYFSEQERLAIKAFPQDEQLKAFFQLWTRKEAYLKALGTGLSHPIPSTDLSSSLFSFKKPLRIDNSNFYCIDIPLFTNYVATVVLSKIDTLGYYDFSI